MAAPDSKDPIAPHGSWAASRSRKTSVPHTRPSGLGTTSRRAGPHDADTVVRDALASVPAALEKSFDQLVSNGPVPLEGIELTRAVLFRMRAFYIAQAAIKDLLGKRYAGAGADFFVETVSFYLKALVDTHGLGVQVAAERPIRPKRGAMRPDISLWREDSCLACIECKTQLGWNRDGWEADFSDRKQRLASEFPHSQLFLLVMSAKNWSGFGASQYLGKKYFVLSSEWPIELQLDTFEQTVKTPIEQLFKCVVQLAEREKKRRLPRRSETGQAGFGGRKSHLRSD